MHVILFEIEGLSAERHTEVRRTVVDLVDGQIGSIGGARTGFGVAEANLIVDCVAALLAAAALFLQVKDRKSAEVSSAEVIQTVSAATGTELVEQEVESVRSALEQGTGTVKTRGLEVSFRLNDKVLEVRGRRHRDD